MGCDFSTPTWIWAVGKASSSPSPRDRHPGRDPRPLSGQRPRSARGGRPANRRGAGLGLEVRPILIYSAIASLDGYTADEDGNFDWAVPDEEVHAFINDLERPVGTYLYGRRMYETMAGWETDPALAAQSPIM